MKRFFLILVFLHGVAAFSLMILEVGAFANEREGGESNKDHLHFSKDVPKPLRSVIQSRLEEIFEKTGSTETPLFREIFGAFSERPLRKWFLDRVRKIDYDVPDPSESYVTAFEENRVPKTLFVTPLFQSSTQPAISLTAILFHEARHTENGHWLHHACPTPFLDALGKEIISPWAGIPLSGKFACDDTEYGSYAVEAVLLTNMGRYCTNCSEPMKVDALRFGRVVAQRVNGEPGRSRLLKDLGLTGDESF